MGGLGMSVGQNSKPPRPVISWKKQALAFLLSAELDSELRFLSWGQLPVGSCSGPPLGAGRRVASGSEEEQRDLDLGLGSLPPVLMPELMGPRVLPP